MQMERSRIGIKRAAAGILCAVLLLLALFSGIFIAHANTHICNHNDCPICAGIRQCEANMKLLGLGRIVYCVAALLMLLSVAVLPRLADEYAEVTLITHHVRLNN